MIFIDDKYLFISSYYRNLISDNFIKIFDTRIEKKVELILISHLNFHFKISKNQVSEWPEWARIQLLCLALTNFFIEKYLRVNYFLGGKEDANLSQVNFEGLFKKLNSFNIFSSIKHLIFLRRVFIFKCSLFSYWYFKSIPIRG